MQQLAEATASTPWWGVPVIAGLFTILGVAASQFITWKLDRTRAAREDERRWLADRREIYTDALHSFETWSKYVVKYWDDGIDFELSAKLEAECDRAQERLDLVALDEVTKAVAAVVNCLHSNVQAYRDGDQGQEAKKRFFSEYVATMGAFVKAARKELGVDK